MSQRKSLTQAYIKAVFLSDIRGKFKKCQICSREFGFTRAEHQCKRCLRAVCEKCSNSKFVFIAETGPNKRPHRGCDICKEETQWIRRFIEQQKVSIGVDTFAIEWLKASGLTVDMAKEEYEKAQQDLNKDKGEFLKMKQELSAVMNELWLNLNYSFREFLNYMIKESEYESITQSVSRVLGALLVKYPDIGYSSDQMLITVFLLCFASEASAYALLTILYSEVIPFNTYPAQLKKYPYDYTSEVDKIIQVIEQAFRIKQNEIILLKPFIRNKIARYLQPLGINFFILSTSFFLINQILLNPKNGYDNLLKCLASAFSIRFEEIKNFPSSFEEAESQLLKGVLSGELEKFYLQTKLIIFLQHNHGITQSVIINRPLEIKQQQQVVHQIKIEHIQDQKTQRKIEQEEDMLKYTVLQDNDFQFLRRKTVQIQAQPQVDEEKANLKEYIEKIEETLMLKHKYVIELQNRIKELQNQPPQIVNKDADQQLLQANEQLRMRIAAQDQEIYILQEQKKYSDKLQEDSQQIIHNLKKSNFELNEQLKSQISSNSELQTAIKLLRTQVDQSSSSQQMEKNYQINISVQSKHTEDKLLLQLEEERQKIFNLEISNNQMNKEYIALQQLNQDKLRIIGNLEVRLIQAEAAKRDREKYYIELIELKKKIEGHELAIIQQQEQYNILLEGYNKQNIEIDLLKKEKLTLSEESHKRESELQLIISSLRSQLQELQSQLDSITIQLNQSLQINQKLQNLILEKDQNIEQLNIKIKIEIRRYEELTIQLNYTIEEHKRILSEKELLILNLRQNDSSFRDQIQQLRNELEVRSQLLIKLQGEFDTQRQNQQNFQSKYQLVFNELDQLKSQWNILNQNHVTLVETHRITLLELDNLRGQHSSLLSEHSQLSEKHKLIIIELNDFRNKQTILQGEHNALTEKYRLIIIELQSVNERCVILTSQQNESSSKHNLIVIELNQFKERFNSLTQQYNQLNEKYHLVVLELNTMKDKYDILTREHHHLNEQHKLILIQIQTLDEKHRLLINDHNTLQEQHRLIIIQYNSAQQNLTDYNDKIRIIDELRLLILQSEEKYNLLITQNKQLQDKYQLDISIHLKRVSELELLIVELEKKLLEMNNIHNSLRIQIEQYILRISILEQEKSEFEKNYNELTIFNQNHKVTVLQLEERIVVLVAEVQYKETYIKELLIIIEKQKVSIIDYEELIRRLKAQIVDQEKQIARLKLTLKQFKELSTELAQID